MTGKFKTRRAVSQQKDRSPPHTHGSGCDRPEKGEIFSGWFASVIKLTHSGSHAHRQPTDRDQPETHEHAITAYGGIDV